MLILITGQFGSGKTTQVQKVVESATDKGLQVAGVVCPAVFNDGIKTGIDARFVPGTKKLTLAKRVVDDDLREGSRWDFNTESVMAVNQHLDACQPLYKNHLLIVDEIGPQEFEFKRGFMSAMRILCNQSYVNAMVVVRPSLIDAAVERWGPAHIIDISQLLAEEVPPGSTKRSDNSALLEKILTLL